MEYATRAHRTGYGTQTRVLVSRKVDGYFNPQKWDDVMYPTAAAARRGLRGMRDEYGARVTWEKVP